MQIKVPWWHAPLVFFLPGSLTFLLWKMLPTAPRSLELTLLVPVGCSFFVFVYLLLAGNGRVKMKMSRSQVRKSLPLTGLLFLTISLGGILLDFGIACLVSFAFLGCYVYYMHLRYFNSDVMRGEIQVEVPPVPPLAVWCSLIAAVTWVIFLFKSLST